MIDKAEDRQCFDTAMKKNGLETRVLRHRPYHGRCAGGGGADVGFSCIILPSFTMGCTGGGISYNRGEFEAIYERGLDWSHTTELLIRSIFYRLERV